MYGRTGLPAIIKSLCVLLSAALFVALVAGRHAQAQQADVAAYPSKPITFIIPLPPGVAADLSIRLLLRSAEKYIGQPIIPVNKPGAGLTLGIAELAKSRPDGYTIGFTAFGPMTVVPFIQKVPFHPINDFTQVMQFSTSNPGLIVRADSPYNSLKDIIGEARQKNKKMSFGATAIGLAPTVMLKIGQKENVELVHIPFGAAGAGETALLGGHVDMVAGDFSSSYIEAGKTKLLVLWREERADEYPNTPILKELGYDMPLRLFFGVQVPKGVPEGIVKKLEEGFARAIREPEFVKGMKELRFPIFYRNSRDLNEYVARSYELYREFFK
ncbi:MAG: tripartite tricarboxylate transporter substrate binding protein [Betaproteobacteria bacterium]|nr:tripartite tricarboxylate transporter substrate binding protein [Betaproteobacteria bacterium]